MMAFVHATEDQHNHTRRRRQGVKMNSRLYYGSENIPITPIEELSRIVLLKEFEAGSVLLPAGSTGTVVSVYGEGEAYGVEFVEPVYAIVTLNNCDIKAIAGAERDSFVGPANGVASR
jgi:hypothetical protein